MERDVGDILDRWSISKLKAERIGTEENKREFKDFEIERQALKKKYPIYDWEQLSTQLLDIYNYIRGQKWTYLLYLAMQENYTTCNK